MKDRPLIIRLLRLLVLAAGYRPGAIAAGAVEVVDDAGHERYFTVATDIVRERTGAGAPLFSKPCTYETQFEAFLECLLRRPT